MWFGWTKVYVDDNGYPTEEITQWKASVFIFFTRVIYIGKITEA